MFYEFYEQKTGIKIETDLRSKIIVDNQLLRTYLILQYIQDNKMDLETMSDVFMMSQKSIKKTLNSLEDGVEFKEIKVKIPIVRVIILVKRETLKNPIQKAVQSPNRLKINRY